MNNERRTKQYTTSTPLPEYPLWKWLEEKRIPFSFELELTARCNNNCRHCYINLPADDPQAPTNLLFKAARVTLSKAAELADMTIYDFMKVCKENQIAVIDITREELLQELESMGSV